MTTAELVRRNDLLKHDLLAAAENVTPPNDNVSRVILGGQAVTVLTGELV